MKLLVLIRSGAKETVKTKTPKPTNANGFTKNSLNEEIPIINIVEKGSEQARIFNPKLISKVGFVCLSFSSIDCIAVICAYGQKLQAL